MTTRLYPQTVSNKNVPDNVYLVADVSQMSDEIHYTYYIDRIGKMFRVADWSMSKPEDVLMFQLCRLTGDSEQMITARWSSFFYWKDQE